MYFLETWLFITSKRAESHLLSLVPSTWFLPDTGLGSMDWITTTSQLLPGSWSWKLSQGLVYLFLGRGIVSLYKESLHQSKKMTWKNVQSNIKLSINKWSENIVFKVSLWEYYVCYSFRRVRLFVTPWNAVCQAPMSIGFSRQEYWSGLPFFSRGSSWSRDWTWVNYIIGRLYYLSYQGSPCSFLSVGTNVRANTNFLPSENKQKDFPLLLFLSEFLSLSFSNVCKSSW